MTGQWAKRAGKVVIVLAFAILVETSFGNDLRVHEVAPDFMLLLAVSAGFSAGPDAGAVVGFASGLVADLFLQNTPFGLSALAYSLAGFAVGWMAAYMAGQRLLLAPFAAAAGTVMGVTLFVVIGYVVGEQQLVAPGKRWLVELALIEALYAAVFALPAAVLMGWALRRPAMTSATLAAAAPSSVVELPPRRRQASLRSRRRHRPRARVR
ncbi:MAG TPA: rod shape-determining protein MreD [Acidimicrobiales bacterium]|nr:rod shape-determining protein MreD [Acidimicrobiales bacterium]